MLGTVLDKLTDIKLSNAKNIIQKNTNREIAKTLAAVHTHTHGVLSFRK